MYARLVKFRMGPGTRDTADALVQQFSKALQARAGLEKVYFMADYETGTYISLALWETKDDAENGFREVSPKLQEALKGLVDEPPSFQLFEVVGVAEPVV